LSSDVLIKQAAGMNLNNRAYFL